MHDSRRMLHPFLSHIRSRVCELARDHYLRQSRACNGKIDQPRDLLDYPTRSSSFFLRRSAPTRHTNPSTPPTKTPRPGIHVVLYVQFSTLMAAINSLI